MRHASNPVRDQNGVFPAYCRPRNPVPALTSTMSFGVSITDILAVIRMAKQAVEDCRHAPNVFAEASRISQSLYLLLESVRVEFQNADSLLHKDERTSTDFAIHFKNCEHALKPLADLLSKYKSLSGPNIRILDRVRFPKRDYLEYRGNLAFYTARLSEFLQTVGLGSLGRIEQKVKDIKDHLPNILGKLDQLYAEFRIMGDRESVLSDHPNDEKLVWKTFRSKLNNAGFTSQMLREHEAAIFLRIRELTGCGLLDADGSTSVWTEDVDPVTKPVYQMSFDSSKTLAAGESDAEDEKTIAPKPSVRNLRPRKSTDSVRSLKRTVSDPNGPQEDSTSPSVALPRRSTVPPIDAGHGRLKSTNLQHPSFSTRIWRNPRGEALLKGSLSSQFTKNGQWFVAVTDTEKQEVLIPCSNLSEGDLDYVDSAYGSASSETMLKQSQNETPLPKHSPPPTYVETEEDEGAIEMPRRRRPEILVGRRSRPKLKWKYRETGSPLPEAAPFASRTELTSDLLPNAASKGDLSRVKRLLASGEHIESKGPISYTETTTDSEGNPSSVRHSYPETTALYLAAYGGHLDVAHYLLKKGADVNTRNGYDGEIGDPILFYVIRNGQEWTTRLLLEYEAKMEAYGPTTALHVACSQPKRSIVRLLLDYGAFIDAKDHLSRTPLYLASVGGFIGSVEILLEEGARTNVIAEEGQTALYKAAGKGREDIVEVLLRYGADPAVGRGRFGETTIYKAAWYNELDVVEHLITFEADVNIKNNKKMKSYKDKKEKLLHGVLAGLSKDHAIMNTWGKTALHAAAYRGHGEMVRMLIDAGADIEATGNDNVTPMYLAAQQKHKGLVQIFLKAGAQLETEKTDPVMALIHERNKNKERTGKELIREHKKEMTKMGTSDTFVSIVAGLTKSWANSRRGT
jgi:ankyrin repeat protein